MSEITKPILLDETGRRIADALGLIAIAQAGSAANIESWESVQQIVRNGLGPKAFPVGARLTSAHSSYASIEWDVVAHNQHKKPAGDSAPTMTLLMHACIYGRMIDASEMLWANTGESALPAGTYNFTLYKGGNGGRTEEDGTYQFTITEPIPVGGGWTHNKVGNWYEDTANYKPEFQPALPARGATQCSFRISAHIRISTRAPREGSDLCAHLLQSLYDRQFQPALPASGATKGAILCPLL